MNERLVARELDRIQRRRDDPEAQREDRAAKKLRAQENELRARVAGTGVTFQRDAKTGRLRPTHPAGDDVAQKIVDGEISVETARGWERKKTREVGARRSRG